MTIVTTRLNDKEIEVIYAALKAYNIDADPEWPTTMSRHEHEAYLQAHYRVEDLFDGDCAVVVIEVEP